MQRKETKMSQVAIRALLQEGFTRQEIMEHYGISRDTIQKAIRVSCNTEDLTKDSTCDRIDTDNK